jgi:hypothetical protein
MNALVTVRLGSLQSKKLNVLVPRKYESKDHPEMIDYEKVKQDGFDYIIALPGTDFKDIEFSSGISDNDGVVVEILD